jgi:exopolyphosphatase/guanosine-5'-triphosphate,3'-diphosphate pyrophosphatase
MILGAIDVGSNSVKLLVASVSNGRIRVLDQRSAVMRLGGRIDRTRLLATSAQDRTIALLRKYRRLCERHEVERMVAVGTEALRVARNGLRFAERVRREAGVPLRILAGRDEARLAFLGATSGRPERRVAAIDIGGGSTELMFGAPGKIRGEASLPLGAVRLTETHLKSDPPTLAERLSMLQAVNETLGRLPESVRRGAKAAGILLGIGGTCINVARMVKPSARPEGRKVGLEALEDILNRLAELPLAKRKKVPGIDPTRADIILGGARILVETMKKLGIGSFTATIHGLRRGLILETANS